jgi:RNA recognition motif-containing protein
MSEDADRLVYLGNLAHDIKRSEINTLFEPYGNVTSIGNLQL